MYVPAGLVRANTCKILSLKVADAVVESPLHCSAPHHSHCPPPCHATRWSRRRPIAQDATRHGFVEPWHLSCVGATPAVPHQRTSLTRNGHLAVCDEVVLFLLFCCCPVCDAVRIHIIIRNTRYNFLSQFSYAWFPNYGLYVNGLTDFVLLGEIFASLRRLFFSFCREHEALDLVFFSLNSHLRLLHRKRRRRSEQVTDRALPATCTK